MGHYPNAIWMPWIPKTGASKKLESFRIKQPLGLLLHISNSRDNSLNGILSTFNGSANTSHFAVTTSGSVGQFIDTSNHDWSTEWTVSYFTIECCASPGDSLTEPQINSIARLYAWLNNSHNIKVRIATNTHDHGLSYHSMGKTGHTQCPGISVINQRQEIIDRTTAIIHKEETEIKGDFPLGLYSNYA